MTKGFKPKPRPKRALPRDSGEPLHEEAPYTSPEPVSEPPEPSEATEGRQTLETQLGVSARGQEAPNKAQVREDENGVLEDWQCGAKLRGARVGLLCRNPKMRGSSRCRMHGSASFRAREKAKERIIEASDYAAKKLISFMGDPAAPYSVKLAAARDLLDRADLAGKTAVEVEMKPWEIAVQRSVVRVEYRNQQGERINRDGSPYVEPPPGTMPHIRHRRFGPRDGEQPQLPSGEIVDAEVVSDEDGDEETQRVRAEIDAQIDRPLDSGPLLRVVADPPPNPMISLTDLQEGKRPGPRRERGRGTTPTYMDR